jgi:hypothetical protein
MDTRANARWRFRAQLDERTSATGAERDRVGSADLPSERRLRIDRAYSNPFANKGLVASAASMAPISQRAMPSSSPSIGRGVPR